MNLTGGHSGDDISKNRANANKLLVRFLCMMAEKYEFYLCDINGGNKHNAKLYLTEKGEAVASKLHEKLGEADDAITALIGAQREEELMDLLEQLAKFIRKDLRQC